MNMIANLGQATLQQIDRFGDFCRFSGRAFAWIPPGLTGMRKLRLIAQQLYEIGTKSIPVVMITGVFVGMVLAVQVVQQFKAAGLEAHMGAIVNLSVLRELGPVLAGIMLAGRVGGGLTAELGTMRVTEQIDALRAMGADPIRVLVVPRLIACVVMIPILVLYADFMGIWGGYLVSVHVYGVDSTDFWRYAERMVTMFDVFFGPIKCLFFGMAMSLICCFKGFRCAPGAAGVGKACTEAFVASAMAILCLNFFLGMLLTTIQLGIWGFVSIL
ncbi:MAG: ABC transporter permease [Phycisphaerae bacterium]|nr:ABC transporter permease [Phycisphaerae bacterium]